MPFFSNATDRLLQVSKNAEQRIKKAGNLMYEYYLFNHSALVSLQGRTLIFHAYSDDQAVDLGKELAHKLGWEYYSVVEFNGEEEITLYDVSKTDKYNWIACYDDGTYDTLYNTEQGAREWIKVYQPYKRISLLVKND